MLIDNKRKKELKSKAHPLKPVVLLGDKGLTDAVLAEIEGALSHHELIKIKVPVADRDARAKVVLSITSQLKAHLVQGLGQVFTLYREKSDK